MSNTAPPSTHTSTPATTSGARLTIDLEALVHNWQQYQGLRPETESAAVVKANAYGLGSLPVAQALYTAGCRTFFVATLDEAIALRTVIPDREIYVFQGLLSGQESLYITHGLTPCLNTLAQIKAWQQAAAPTGRPLPCAVQFDTGMSRLGLDHRETELLQNDWALMDGLDLRLFMSHMACADEPDHPMNRQQLATFTALKARLPDIRYSLAASFGATLGPDYLFDLIRPGVALYGGMLSNAAQSPFSTPLKPVVTLEAHILQRRTIAAGQSVGYGASFVAQQQTHLVTLDVGYADGFLRSLSGQSHLVCDGYRLPIAGRVSMDTIVVDITDLPDTLLSDKTHLTIVGADRTVEDLADEAGTISYEILTALGHRYRRHYRQPAHTRS